jgi:superfamily II DNA or RNA helicase
VRSHEKGIVNLPTGSGKTPIQCEIAYSLISSNTIKTDFNISQEEILNQLFSSLTGEVKTENNSEEKNGAIVIVSPRILLTHQLLLEFSSYISSKGISAYYMNVNSGKFCSEDAQKIMLLSGTKAYNIPTTTDFTEIKNNFNRAYSLGLRTVITTTYDSVEKIQKSRIPVAAYIFDEAHTLVGSDKDNLFFEATRYESKSKYYFTATPRTTYSDESTGMNNEEIYGKTIYKKVYKELLDLGKVTKPLLHIVTGHRDSFEDGSYDYDGISKCIFSSYFSHEKELKKVSAAPDKIGAKLLVTAVGQLQLQGIFNSKEMKKLVEENKDIHIFALSCEFGVHIDGKTYKFGNESKKLLLKTMKNLKSTDKVILIHIDTLTEGIDCPGITGVLPFRNLGKIKYLQTIGRSSRLHTEDRKKIDSEELKIGDYAKYIKPYNYIIIPVVTFNSNDFTQRYKDLLISLRSEYGFSSEDLKVITNGQAATTLEEIDEVGEGEKQVRSLVDTMTEFYHTIEKQEQQEMLFDKYMKTNMFNDEEKAELIKLIAENEKSRKLQKS